MTNLAKIFSVANYSVIILREIVRVVGGHGCGWAKLNVLQIVSACAWLCSSFNFAKRWHFVCRFTVRLLLVVSSFRVAANIQIVMVMVMIYNFH